MVSLSKFIVQLTRGIQKTSTTRGQRKEEVHLYAQVHKRGSDGGIAFITTIQFVKNRDHRKKNEGSGAHVGLACKKKRALYV